MTGIHSESGVRVTCDGQGLDGTWQRIVNGLPHATLAHAPEWQAVIRDAYGHQPLYLTAEDAEGRRGVLPAVFVRRPLLGSVVVSMPFLDGGGPCASSTAVARALVERLVKEAFRLKATVVEMRCTEQVDVETAPMRHKVNLTLPLPADADLLWRQFDGSVRNQVRKAGRSGLTIEFGGAEKLDDFHGVFATRMHALGSPVHSSRFFTAIFQRFGGRARVVLVRKGTTPIAGLVALACDDVLTVPWASALPEYFSLCSNMLLYWETIRMACLEGYGVFDFGRSTRGSGTYGFKRQWGALESPLYWYTIPISPRRGVSPGDGATAARLVGMWKRLPLAVTRRLGPHVRKYLIQ